MVRRGHRTPEEQVRYTQAIITTVQSRHCTYASNWSRLVHLPAHAHVCVLDVFFSRHFCELLVEEIKLVYIMELAGVL